MIFHDDNLNQGFFFDGGGRGGMRVKLGAG